MRTLKMTDKPKIKILDNSELRTKLLDIVQITSQKNLVYWAVECTKHILPLSTEKIKNIVILGFDSIELWEKQKYTTHQIRQIGFKIHKEARECKSEITKNILRTLGQTIGVCHMKEHAIVASDYAIKVVQLSLDDDFDKITEEREWQINRLLKINNIICENQEEKH